MAASRQALEMMEGAGVTVKRLMPIPGYRNFDPFVLWDDFSISPGNGFPDHPHRGFEAITYLFKGSIEHEDNLGNHSTVFSGGAQRFTAGRGIVHSEMPNEAGNTRGIQLWINLPKRLKGVDPAYQQVNDGDFPINEIKGGEVKIIVGDASPLQLMTPVRYLDVQLEKGAHFKEVFPPEYRGFVYMVNGTAKSGAQSLETGAALFLEQGEKLVIEAISICRFMICFGAPHGEPVFQHGPFVD